MQFVSAFGLCLDWEVEMRILHLMVMSFACQVVWAQKLPQIPHENKADKIAIGMHQKQVEALLGVYFKGTVAWVQRRNFPGDHGDSGDSVNLDSDTKRAIRVSTTMPPTLSPQAFEAMLKGDYRVLGVEVEDALPYGGSISEGAGQLLLFCPLENDRYYYTYQRFDREKIVIIAVNDLRWRRSDIKKVKGYGINRDDKVGGAYLRADANFCQKGEPKGIEKKSASNR